MYESIETQVAIVGAGPGGYAAAFMAADLGLDVTLIDVEEVPGGTCLLRGCIPSKTLLHVAKVLNEARDAEAIGLNFGKPKIDLDKVRSFSQGVIDNMTGGLAQLVKARKVKYIVGRASFRDSNTLMISHKDATVVNLKTQHTILAAGSRPAKFGPLIDSPRLMNSTSALALEEIPKKLLVIGGGYIGLELGSVYSALGSEVSVVEMTDGLLPGADRDLVRPLQKRLEGQLHEILLKTKVAGMELQKNGIKVALEGEEKKSSRLFDRVLVCVGRLPNSTGLGLDNTGADVDEHGFIKVDGQMRTEDPSVFAIGDLVPGPMLAHKASHEGRVAAEVIAGHKVGMDAQAIPAVVFTDPEIAWAGITEDEAKKADRKVKVTRFPWAASGRAATINRTEGLTKLITDPDTDRILGVGICGAGAGELIAEGVLAIEMGATAKDLALTIHPHPTLSETIMESAEAVYGTSTHIYRKK